jgi:hypothetical protein
MGAVYWGAITGFILGTFGYTMVKFVIRPIFKYKKIKKQIVTNLKTYLNNVYNERELPVVDEREKVSARALRESSSELNSCYDYTLPNWYKLLIKSRGESPDDASKHLMLLSSTRDYKHAQARTEKIRQTLGL